MSDQNQPYFHIQRSYLRDLSLEQPNSPAIFLEQERLTVEVQINVSSERLEEDIFEVSVIATITTKIKEKIAFLIEGKQSGIFAIRNIPLEQLDSLIGITCPSIIYPYLRANLADAISRAGFQPIHLAEINFQSLYEQRKTELVVQKS
ncbi:protein-export chaperone SecB [Candidatus Pandoraea novymonadis]|uniref:Protein-export protein SecB n=1 Tax=Candidatus Pandoraea novymonadis TaxID=1808959 RepID=A0ABX5FDA6_9BURK|nr:protein-export chaperone SecB [Candidatus Pandoraea novymonadis]PSB91748.1 Protein-export protein SecB [Candidatus Pandoraea novymonadis]